MALTMELQGPNGATVLVVSEGIPGPPGSPGASAFAGAVVESGFDSGTNSVFIDVVSSPWGIDSDGNPYYDSSGVTNADERAIPVFNADGTISVVVPGVLLIGGSSGGITGLDGGGA